MSTLTTHTTASRDSHSVGLCKFNTTSNAIEVSDGTNWLLYDYDGIAFPALTNTYSLGFDATNEYLELGDTGGTTFFDSTNPFSISAWVKITSYSPSYQGLCILKTDQSNGWILGMASGQSNYNGVWFGSSANFVGLTTNSQSIANSFVGAWKHVVVTYDGVSRSTASSFKLYIDGVAQSLVNSGSYGSCANHSRIGEGNTPSVVRVNGLVDEVSMFTSELGSPQISGIYNSGVGGVDISSLSPFGWWRMGDNDSGTGTTVTDQGSGGNNGTLTNSPTFSTTVPS
jgi:hypothetical protein